jgi:choline dehydrogenase
MDRGPVDDFDSVVVGAGSAGAVIAARLTESGAHRVALIDAGPFYPSAEAMPAPLHDPWNPQLTGHDWGFQAYVIEPSGDRESVAYPRGRLVGGSSAVNGTYGLRGTQADFNAWAATGIHGWDWASVLPFFNKLETDADYGNQPYHGDAGPTAIMRVPRDQWPASYLAFEEAALKRGFPPCDDLNAPRATGVGPTPRNQAGHLRASTLVSYLHPAGRRPNLTIMGNAWARRVLFDGTRAIGVEIERDGHLETIAANRVIVSAGAIGSPHLLKVSGVGPAAELRRHGIIPVVDLPGVGANLADHPYVPVVATTPEPDPGCGFRVALEFSSAEDQHNDMMIIPSLLQVASVNFPVPTSASAVLILPAILAKPSSRGWVSLTSADPADPPEIHANFLAEDRDIRRMKDLVRLAYEFATTSPLSDALADLLMPDASIFSSDEALTAYMRETVGTAYHCVGTCKMGSDADPQAVVDERLAVRGTSALFVADASIMPEITAGLTNISCVMIGERAADLFGAASAQAHVEDSL